ncbi:restriction endonuclease subunit S [Helicobacter pylori]|uniref:restriction endonuclease subunit S n=1 Tax=Helicobacter pylori TaxID=210 RepID=UPI000EB0A097|nr:restriction endonuclease subunit S [Helicobacter pylori]RKV51870.1 restriction endonuclease subunit S [Helicobacter pylori]
MDALTTPLPKAWQKVRLGDIAEIKRGVRITKNELDVFGKYPVVSGGVGFLGYTNNFNRYENTITIAQYGTAGYVNFQKNKFWANDVCFCVYPNKDVIKNIFLYYFLKVNQNYLYEISNRNATPYSISKDKILDFEILLPPLNEQIAIANILSDVDRYLYSLDALILKKESVKKALSFELLSQRKRLKGFNQNWQKVRLGTYKYRRGSFPQPYGNPQWYSDNGMPFVQVYDVGENFKLNQKTKQKISKIAQPMSVFVPKNSVIITLQGTIDRVALTQYDCYCDRTILIFDNNTLNDVNKYFFVLSLFTKFEEEKRKADGSIIKTITKQTLKDFEIPLPPLNEQIAIANILSDVDSEIISLKNKKRQFENIKKALNHDLMSAKIRVLKK